jgi:hypothetical protein|tara:strand:+ start:14338 stop:14811 length:474 start_codon:yes stop_codon:yes gene_type:complete
MSPRLRQWYRAVIFVSLVFALGAGVALWGGVYLYRAYTLPERVEITSNRVNDLVDNLREPVIVCNQEVSNNTLKIKCWEEGDMWGEWMLIWEQEDGTPLTSYWSLAGAIGWPFANNPGSVTIKFRSESLREAELVVVTDTDLRDCTTENGCKRVIVQ